MAVSKDYKINVIVETDTVPLDSLSEGTRKAVENVRDLSSTILIAEQNLKQFSLISSDIDRIDGSLKQISTNMEKFTATTQPAVTVLDDISNAVSTVENSFRLAERAFSLVTDEDALNNLLKFLAVIENIARITGNKAIADGAQRLATTAVTGFENVNSLIGDTIDLYDEFRGRIALANAAMEAFDFALTSVKNTALVFLSVGVAEGLLNISKNASQGNSILITLGRTVNVTTGNFNALVGTVTNFTKQGGFRGAIKAFIVDPMIGLSQTVRRTAQNLVVDLNRIEDSLRNTSVDFRGFELVIAKFRQDFVKGLSNLGAGVAGQFSDITARIGTQVRAIQNEFRGFELILGGTNVSISNFARNLAGSLSGRVVNSVVTLKEELRGIELIFGGIDTLARSSFIRVQQTISNTFSTLQSSFNAMGKDIDSLILQFGNFSQTLLRDGAELVTLFTQGFAQGVARAFRVSLIASVRNFGSEIKTVTSQIRSNFTPGLIGAVEKATIFNGVFFTLGTVLAQSEEATEKWIGRILIAASLLAGGFATAIGFAITKIADFAVRVGQTLVNSMEAFEEKANKAQDTFSQFAFTITNFSDALGKRAIGSLEEWQIVLKEVVANTTFSAQEVQKAISLIVKETQVTGLSLNQNIKLLNTASDIAASTGRTIEEVVLALTKGITGNTQATIALGIALTDTALEQTKYVKSMGATVSQLSESQKQQARFNKIIKASAPLTGAAALQLNSITGATKEYNQSLDDLQARLGSANMFTQEYLVGLTNLNKLFLDLPDTLLDAVGALQDFLGVSLIIIGTVLKYTLIIAALRSAYAILNAVVLTSVAVQKTLTFLFLAVGKSVGVQTVAVTSLSAAYVNLGVILKASVLGSFKALGAFLLANTKTLLVTIGRIVKSPLFLGAAAIVVGVLALVKAYKQVTDSLAELEKQTRTTNSQTQETVSLFKELGDLTKVVFGGLVDLSALAIVGIVQIINHIKLAINGLQQMKAAVFGTEEEVLKLQLSSVDTLESIDNFSQIADKSMGNLLGRFEDTAIASDNVDESIKALTNTVRGFSKVLQTIDQDTIENLRIQTLGTESEKLMNRFFSANTELNRARAIGIKEEGKLRKATNDEIISLEVKRQQASLDIIAFRQDFLTNLAKQEQELAMDALRNNGEVIKAIQMRGAIELKEFKEQVAQLKQTGKLTKEQLQLVKEVEKAIADSTAYEIAAERQKQLEKGNRRLIDLVTEMESKTKDLDAVQQDRFKTELEIIANQEKRSMVEADALASALKKAGLLTDEYQVLIDRYKQASSAAAEFARSNADIALGDLSLDGMLSSLENFVERGIKPVINKMVDDIRNKLRTVTLGDVGSGIIAGFEAGAELARTLLSGEFLNLFSQLGEFVENIPNMLAEAAQKFVEVFDNLIQNIDSIVANIVESFGNALTGLVERLPKIFGEVIPKLINGLADIFVKLAEQLPTIFESILSKLPEILSTIFEAIPRVVDSLIRAIPGVVEAIADNIGPIIESFIEGLIGGAGEIVASLIDALLIEGGLERIVKALIEAIPRIAVALVRGIVRGLQRALGAIGEAIFGRFKAPKAITDLPAQISKAANKLGTDLATGASKIFAVKDLENAAKGLEVQPTDILENIDEVIAEAFAAFDILQWFVDGIKGAFQRLTNFFRVWLQRAWEWMLEKIFRPLARALERAWKWMIAKVFRPIGEAFTKAWNFMIEQIVTPFGDFLARAFNWVFTQIFEPFAGLLKRVFDAAIDNIFEPLAQMLTEVWQLAVSRIFEPLKEVVVGAVAAAFQVLADILKEVFSTSLSEALSGLVEKFIGFFIEVFEGAAGVLAKPFDGVNKVMQSLADALTKITSPFENVAKALNDIKSPFNGLKNAFNTIIGPFKALADALGKFKLPGALGGGSGKGLFEGNVSIGGAVNSISSVGKSLGFQSGGPITSAMALANGGIVDAVKAQNGLFVDFRPQGVDVVPAVLQPGEFVVSRRGVNAVGQGMLKQINAGITPGSSGGVSIGQVVINAKTNLSPESIDREVIPRLEQSIKRKSQDGKFVISKNGIR